MHIPREQLIESLIKLAPKLLPDTIPQEIVAKAIAHNPWFTRYYIQKRLEGIVQWLAQDVLSEFVSDYPFRSGSEKRVGVIAAGNLPLVGFHDILVCLLCGHICIVKPSRRDSVLLKWLREEWIDILPEIASRFLIVKQLDRLDFLLATGSNNSARYFEANFGQVDRIVRKNRYAVAILHSQMSENQLEGLCEDILLFNGLGCRNVSNLAVFPDFNWEKLEEKLRDYANDRLNPLYLERVLYEKNRIEFMDEKVRVLSKVLIRPSSSFSFSTMGVIQGVKIQTEHTANKLIDYHKEEIQCVVGRGVAYGCAQYPVLKDFADNLDTMSILSGL